MISKKSALVKMDDAEIVEYLEDEFVMCEIFEVWEHVDTSLLGNVLFILSIPYQFWIFFSMRTEAFSHDDDESSLT